MKVLVIGSSVCDVIINVQQMPLIGEDENVISQSLNLGGCAFNVANILKYLNIPFDLLSPVGIGIYGDFVRNEMIKKNIPILLESKEDNGCCYCIVDKSGERTFIAHHGGEYHFYPQDFLKINPKDYQYVYVCGLELEEETGINIIEFLEENDFHIVFASSSRIHHINKKRLERILSLHPILHFSQNEILSYNHIHTIEEAAIDLYKKTQNIVIVTLGSQGCYYYDGKHHYVDPYPTKIVDTIGAGDSHVASVIAMLYQNQSIDKAIDKGNQIAAKVVSQKGANLI